MDPRRRSPGGVHCPGGSARRPVASDVAPGRAARPRRSVRGRHRRVERPGHRRSAGRRVPQPARPRPRGVPRGCRSHIRSRHPWRPLGGVGGGQRSRYDRFRAVLRPHLDERVPLDWIGRPACARRDRHGVVRAARRGALAGVARAGRTRTRPSPRQRRLGRSRGSGPFARGSAPMGAGCGDASGRRGRHRRRGTRGGSGRRSSGAQIGGGARAADRRSREPPLAVPVDVLRRPVRRGAVPRERVGGRARPHPHRHPRHVRRRDLPGIG